MMAHSMCVEREGNRVSYEETKIESGAGSPTWSLIPKDKDEKGNAAEK